MELAPESNTEVGVSTEVKFPPRRNEPEGLLAVRAIQLVEPEQQNIQKKISKGRVQELNQLFSRNFPQREGGGYPPSVKIINFLRCS